MIDIFPYMVLIYIIHILIIDGIWYIPYIYVYINGKHVLCSFDGGYI